MTKDPVAILWKAGEVRMICGCCFEHLKSLGKLVPLKDFGELLYEPAEGETHESMREAVMIGGVHS